jgi:type IV pilus assembly protein PilQ
MMKTNLRLLKYLQALLLIMLTTFSSFTLAEDQSALANKIESVDVSSLPGGRLSIRVRTSQPLTNPPAGFALTGPSRIALDFPQVGNGLGKNSINAEQGMLKTISLAQGKERTRMVLNLSNTMSYNTSISGNEVSIILQPSIVSAGSTVETKFAEPKLDGQKNTINKVDFVRGKNGEGRIIVDLSDPTVGINIKQKGKVIEVDFINTEVPADLQRRLNVTNFNTPVVFVDTMKKGKNGHMVIEPKGAWEQSAYQADKKFIIDVRQLIEDPNKLVPSSKVGYAGEKLSLNFQNIEVRSVLQVIADFTGLNIISSDTVAGNITLRLKDVPWDQALEIIMQSKGLGKRKNGNVILIAPADEIAANEKQILESAQQIEDIEILKTESFTLNYAKATDMVNLLSNPKQKILSKRGSAIADIRTNTVFVQDVPKFLEQVQVLVNKIDIPVKQVMIESRLVLADERFAKSLGARFGVQKQQVSGDTRGGVSGSLGNGITTRVVTPTTGVTTETVTGVGTPPNTAGAIRLATTQIGGSDGVVTPGLGGNDLMSNLPVANAFGSLAVSLFRLPAGLLLNLELSALESDQRGKIVSSPRVTTASQQKAKIAQGTQIPYQRASASGATAVEFKEAVLSLDVTPQITPDDKIIMDLEVKKDRVGQIFNGVPSIDTQNITTQVLVANGETAVLGGIYEQTEINGVDKVPFFGDLPLMGNLFKRKTRSADKTELLIFITPKIMDERLNLQ